MFANALGYEELMGRWSVRLGSIFLQFAQQLQKTSELTGALEGLLAETGR
jgi:hypothetical protein